MNDFRKAFCPRRPSCRCWRSENTKPGVHNRLHSCGGPQCLSPQFGWSAGVEFGRLCRIHRESSLAPGRIPFGRGRRNGEPFLSASGRLLELWSKVMAGLSTRDLVERMNRLRGCVAKLQGKSPQESGQAGTLVDELSGAWERLEAGDERFRQLAENVREVFWLTSPDDERMISVSAAYEEVWGHIPESLSPQPCSWAESIHPDDRDRAPKG